MADTTFRHGNPVNVDYTPGAGNVAEGAVVILGTVETNTDGVGAIAAIAPKAIVNNELGALSVGGGVYDCVNLNNAATGAAVFWDDSAKKVTTVTNTKAMFGFIVADGGGGANSTCKVLHKPYPDVS